MICKHNYVCGEWSCTVLHALVFYCKKRNPGRTNGPRTLMFLKFAEMFKTKKLHTAYATNYNRLTGQTIYLKMFRFPKIS